MYSITPLAAPLNTPLGYPEVSIDESISNTLKYHMLIEYLV